MASKASTVKSIDLNNDRVTYQPHGWRTDKTDRFAYLAKVDRVRVLKGLGCRFTGSPMHRTDFELQAIYNDAKTQSVLLGITFVNFVNEEVPQPQPKEPKEVPMPTTPKVSPRPITEGGGLDAILQSIVADVIGSYVPEVNPETVGAIVDKAMNPYIGIFNDVADKVGNLANVVATMQPKVTEITLPDGNFRKLDGVQHHTFGKVLANVSLRLPTYLVGPAGTGKSTIAENASKALGLDFYSKSCSSQATESSLLGYMSATGQYVGTGFRTAFEHGGVYLLDEVDNGNANVLTVLNSALANTFMAFPDGMIKRHKDFVLVATANTFGHGATAEYVGRNPLDAAFLDRFVSIVVNYDNDIEEAMLNVVGLNPMTSAKWLNVVRSARNNVQNYGLRVVVSPRATVHGAKLLLSDAYTMTEVVEATILKGAKPEVADKVLMGVAL